MKLITWNCNMAFRKKAHLLLAHKPDLLVIPECEHPSKLLFTGNTHKPTDALWFGQNPNKGLGIFSYGRFRLKVLDVHNEALKLIVPLSVSGGGFDFTLFAIWANNPADKDGQYITQIWKALHHYEANITDKRTLLTGDFNSNTIWDKPRREGNHTTVVTRLEEKGIHSLYHKHHQQTQGMEEHPTYYLYRHRDKPYHIDYCFASADMLGHLKSVEVGEHDLWSAYSDHVPVTVSFKRSLYNK